MIYPDDPRYEIIKSFIEETKLEIHSGRERPWGSFEIVFTFDRQAIFHPGRVFGYAYSDLDAAVTAIDALITQEPIDPNFVQFMGEERIATLKEKYIPKPPPEQLENGNDSTNV